MRDHPDEGGVGPQAELGAHRTRDGTRSEEIQIHGIVQRDDGRSVARRRSDRSGNGVGVGEDKCRQPVGGGAEHTAHEPAGRKVAQMPHHRPAEHPAREPRERVGLEPVAVQQVSTGAARYRGEPQRARSGIGGHREGPGKVRGQRVARRAPQPYWDVQHDRGNPQARQGCLERPVTEHRDRRLDSERR